MDHEIGLSGCNGRTRVNSIKIYTFRHKIDLTHHQHSATGRISSSLRRQQPLCAHTPPTRVYVTKHALLHPLRACPEFTCASFLLAPAARQNFAPFTALRAFLLSAKQPFASLPHVDDFLLPGFRRLAADPAHASRAAICMLSAVAAGRGPAQLHDATRQGTHARGAAPRGPLAGT